MGSSMLNLYIRICTFHVHIFGICISTPFSRLPFCSERILLCENLCFYLFICGIFLVNHKVENNGILKSLGDHQK